MTSNGDGRSPSRTRLDTAPVDWGVVIQSLINVAIAEERRFNREVLAEVVAEVNDDLERAVRSLTVELADLKATLAEVRLAFAPTAHRRWICRRCRSAQARCSNADAGCEHREGAQGRRSADAALAEEDRVMTREQIKVGIQIAARMAELRRLAERTTRDYEADSAADNSLPAEHRRLRRMLFAIAAARRGRKGAR
jgi:hypothetical protein